MAGKLHMSPSDAFIVCSGFEDSWGSEVRTLTLFSSLQPLIHFTHVKGTWSRCGQRGHSLLCLSNFFTGASLIQPVRKRCVPVKWLPYYHCPQGHLGHSCDFLSQFSSPLLRLFLFSARSFLACLLSPPRSLDPQVQVGMVTACLSPC